MRAPSFAVKAGLGMLLVAVAPAYCVYALGEGSKKGTLRKPDRSSLERHARVENPFAPPPPGRDRST